MEIGKPEQTGVNKGGTGSAADAELTRVCSRPVRYELLDRAGCIRGIFDTAQAAAQWATAKWPDQEQDEDRTGNGWDIQVVGS